MIVSDMLFILIGVLFFVATWGFVAGCGLLMEKY